jgi:hypothetical protein
MTHGQSSGRVGSGQMQPEELAKDEAIAKSAVALAQLGRLSEAGEVIGNLRRKYSLGQAVRVSIRLMILEAVVWYYTDRRRSSLDRATRALALAKSAKLSELAAESAVWVSHLSFNFEKYDLLRESLHIVFKDFEQLDETTRARACLVIADSNQFLGYSDRASAWYGLARIFARKTTDRTILTAIEFNRVAMAISRLRVERFLSTYEVWKGRKSWLDDLMSIERMHLGLGVNSLSELLCLCEALAHQLENNFDQAAVSLIKIRSAGAAEICGLSNRSLDLEISWCLAAGSGLSQVDSSSLPTLEQISDWEFGEQVIALRELDEISHRLGLSLDREKLYSLHNTAVQHCVAEDKLLKDSIDDSQSFAESIKLLAHGRRESIE